ncbi:MAG TPA: Holliday junction resolvase RuvX [Chthoniobacterales bacterium]|nr:Holliday junction resolvase RuvX [Chthoniobacterales bacterium]HXY60185.1 Holliday junction resolvase RuvX [Chthoniobacterales bacterium]
MNPILGIDFGQARIGLAISDELRFLAHPLQTIPSNSSSVNKIAEIVRDRRVEIVVVGIPRHMSGKVGAAANAALEFTDRLRAQLRCPVETWDERLSTVAAERALREAGRKTHQTRQVVDQVAAQMILQSYLDREGGTGSTDASEK